MIANIFSVLNFFVVFLGGLKEEIRQEEKTSPCMFGHVNFSETFIHPLSPPSGKINLSFGYFF